MSAPLFLPHNADAERGVLCAFLLFPRHVGSICAERRITPEDFHVPAHASMFRHLHRMWTADTGIDLITLTNALREAGELAEVGGPGYVTEVAIYLPTATLIREHLDIIQAKTLLRRIHATCVEHARLAAGDTDVPAEDILLAAQNAIAGIAARQGHPAKPFRALLLETIASIERGDDATADIASGLKALDAALKMRRGDLVVIGGETKSGKTVLAGTILTHAAVHQRRRCAVFSLEMSDVEMVKRALACVGKVNVARLGPEPTFEERAALIRAAQALDAADLEIASDTYDLGSIVARARQWHARRPLDLIVLDYIQLVEFSTGRKGETRQEIVAQISRTCKRLAGELNCVVIGLSQINDEGKLRESRAIGQDANAILSVEMKADASRTIRVVAQRNGPSNVSVDVRWLAEYCRFEDAM